MSVPSLQPSAWLCVKVSFKPVPFGVWQVLQFMWGFSLVHYIFSGFLAAAAGPRTRCFFPAALTFVIFYIISYVERDNLQFSLVSSSVVLFYISGMTKGVTKLSCVIVT